MGLGTEGTPDTVTDGSPGVEFVHTMGGCAGASASSALHAAQNVTLILGEALMVERARLPHKIGNAVDHEAT